MIDPAVPLSLAALAGLTPSAAILSLRQLDAKRWAAGLEPYLLEVPGGCDPEELVKFLGSLSGLLPSRWERPVSVRGIGLEVTSTADGISHHLLVPGHQTEIVTGQLRANLPGVRLTPDPSHELLTPILVGELATANPNHQLRADSASSVATSILASLQPLGEGERASVQTIVLPLSPRMRPSSNSLGQVLSGLGRSDPGEVSKAVQLKYNLQLFACSIRLVIEAPTPARARQLLARIAASYHAANSPDATLRRRRVSNGSVRRAYLQRRPPTLSRPCLLNSSELAGLMAVPPPGISLMGLRFGGSRLLPASTDIPTVGCCVLAQSNYPGARRPLALSVRGAQQHVEIVGPPGTGKSSLMGNMIIELIEAGYGVVVVDPKRDLVTDVCDRIPKHRQPEVAIFDPIDERPVGLATLQSSDGNEDLAAEQIFGILKALNTDSWGPRLADLLRASLHTLARTKGATLTELPALLTDASFRAKIVGALDDPLGLSAVWSWFDALSEGERSQAVSPILNKARPWLIRSKMRHVLGQADPLLDLDEVLSKGQILLAPLSAGELGDDAASLLGAILISKLFGAIMRRVSLPASERRPTFVFIDEAQILGKLPVPLADMLAVARGMAVSVVIGHQTLSQFDPTLRSAVLGAARSRVLFQMGAEDATRFARELTPYLGADDLRGLGPYEVVASISTGDRVAPPATGRTRPLPPGNGDAELVRELSRQRWGRDRDEIESELRRRQERPSGSGPVGRQRRSK